MHQAEACNATENASCPQVCCVDAEDRPMEDEPSPPAPSRSRTVNDFDTPLSLRRALQSCAAGTPLCVSNGNKGEGEMATASSLGGAACPSVPMPPISQSADWLLDNLDMTTSCAQNLEEEMARLQVLKSYHILDSEREHCFERITALASRMFGVPIALVSLVDLGRQWFMSNRGLGEVRETPRNVAFCAHAILSTQDLLVVPDATKDPRFSSNGLVTGEPHIRFYAGAPLICPEGYKLGTLCIIDCKTRPMGLSIDEKQNLRELAALVVESMVSRRKEKDAISEGKNDLIACTAHDLLTPLTAMQLNLSLLADDEQIRRIADGQQLELLQTALSCSHVMSRICHRTIKSFRGELEGEVAAATVPRGHESSDVDSEGNAGCRDDTSDQGDGVIVISRLVDSVKRVIEPFPKSVPVTIDVDPNVPASIISDDLKVFRSAVNMLTNACQRAETGSIKMKIFVQQAAQSADPADGGEDNRVLVFEVEDNGPAIPVESYPTLFRPFGNLPHQMHHRASLGISVASIETDVTRNMSSGLGLFSVANNIASLGGEYGFFPRETETGSVKETRSDEVSEDVAMVSSLDLLRMDQRQHCSVFWFAIPLVVPGSNGVGVKLKSSAATKPKEVDAIVDTADTTSETKGKSSRKRALPESGSSADLASTRRAQNRSTQNNAQESNEDIESYRKEQGLPMPPAEISTGAKVFASQTTSVPSENSNSDRTPGKNIQRGKRALVIDDSLTIRKGIDRALTRLDYTVTQACNGMEGMRELKNALYDLVLCDFLMPVMDGLDCVQQYRSWEVDKRPWFRQYIIGISAHASNRDAERGLDAGMDKFLAKPLALSTIKELTGSAEVAETARKLDTKFEETMVAKERHDSDASIEMRFVSDDVSVSSMSFADHSNINPVCLIGVSSKGAHRNLLNFIDSGGWRASIVENGADALRLLKMRNWDAVFLDDQMAELSGTGCCAHFREWEISNRIAKQNYIFLMSEHYQEGNHSIVPHGFDGAISKPISTKDVAKKLEAAGSNRWGCGGRQEGGGIMLR